MLREAHTKGSKGSFLKGCENNKQHAEEFITTFPPTALQEGVTKKQSPPKPIMKTRDNINPDRICCTSLSMS